VFLRILIWSVVLFFLARFLWRIVAPFFVPTDADPHPQAPESSQKPKEEFKDVRDAKFIDVPKSPPSDSAEHEKE
jgi:hypothetical protein